MACFWVSIQVLCYRQVTINEQVLCSAAHTMFIILMFNNIVCNTWFFLNNDTKISDCNRNYRTWMTIWLYIDTKKSWGNNQVRFCTALHSCHGNTFIFLADWSAWIWDVGVASRQLAGAWCVQVWWWCSLDNPGELQYYYMQIQWALYSLIWIQHSSILFVDSAYCVTKPQILAFV